MPEIGTLGLMSGDGKRSVGHRPQATAPILDSTSTAPSANDRRGSFQEHFCRASDELVRQFVTQLDRLAQNFSATQLV
jgi:hypothetical protein